MPINNKFNDSRGFGLPIIIVCLSVLLLLGIVISIRDNKLPIFSRSLTSTSSTEQSSSSNWKTQNNSQFGISFKLPTNWDSIEISNSLVIAPQDVIADIGKNKDSETGFGGGTFLTMQIQIIDDTYPLDNFKSNQDKTVSNKEVTVGGNKSIEYITKYLSSLPGIEKGAIIKTYILDANGKKYAIDLLDKSQDEILQKIISSITFIKQADDIVGQTKDQVTKIKGKPLATAQNKQTKKEVWVYLSKGDESSGTYIFFQNDKVTKTEVDEYNGALESNSWIK